MSRNNGWSIPGEDAYFARMADEYMSRLASGDCRDEDDYDEDCGECQGCSQRASEYVAEMKLEAAIAKSEGWYA